MLWTSDTPGKSGKPKVDDVDEDSVTLSWDKPKEDGGDKLQGYVVEVKEKGSDKWKPVNEKIPCKDTKFTGKLLTFIPQAYLLIFYVFLSLYSSVSFLFTMPCSL